MGQNVHLRFERKKVSQGKKKHPILPSFWPHVSCDIIPVGPPAAASDLGAAGGEGGRGGGRGWEKEGGGAEGREGKGRSSIGQGAALQPPFKVTGVAENLLWKATLLRFVLLVLSLLLIILFSYSSSFSFL